jgi:hypothetical protein
VEFYWEGWQRELISPELALVDPVLREKLLSQPEPPTDHEVAPLDSVEPTPELQAFVSEYPRRNNTVAWASLTASLVTALALFVLALSQRPHHAPPAPAVAPTAVAIVTTYRPPAPPVDHRTEAQKLELEALLRSPARDPFSPVSSGG